MICLTMIFLFVSASTSVVLQMPPGIPAKYPPTNQGSKITGEFLTSPLVQNALDYVNSVVDEKIMAISPSTYISGSNTKYNADPIKYRYWPYYGNSEGVRKKDTKDFRADIYTCPNANDWGLTYDDGPTIDPKNKAGTTELINALSSASMTATFFMVGGNAYQYPSVVKFMHNSGMQLASHSWTHHPMTSLTNAEIVAEIKYTEAAIFAASGVVVTYFRPPYGDVDDRVRAILTALGYRNVLWDRDSQDASGGSNKTPVLAEIKSWFKSGNGFISLEHDISTFTTSIGIEIVNAIKSAGDAFPLEPKDVGRCQGVPLNQWYWFAGAAGETAKPAQTPATAAETQAKVTINETPKTDTGSTGNGEAAKSNDKAKTNGGESLSNEFTVWSTVILLCVAFFFNQ